MTQVRLLSDLATATVLAAFCSSLLFIVVYSIAAPWWKTAIGRALVLMDGGIALTLLPLVLKFAFGLTTASLFFAWFQIGAIGLVAASTLWRSWIVARIQVAALADHPPGPPQGAQDVPAR